MSLSSWMQGARVGDGGGLLIPGSPVGRACDLLLIADGVRVSLGEIHVDLAYEGCGRSGGDAWGLTGWTATRGGSEIGVALSGTGSVAADVVALRDARPRLVRGLGALSTTGGRAPLLAASFVNAWVDADRMALDTLCRTLATRPTWRRQLADPQRVARLLRDLATREHGARATRTGVMRRAVETSVAMLSLGLVHPLNGRPLPDEVLQTEDDAVRSVMRKLADNPYALPADEAKVRATVKRRYLDVPPWPFDALLPVPTDRDAASPSS
jgi:hypothetical protein